MPKDATNPWEILRDKLASRIVEDVQALPEAPAPMDAVKLSPQEQQQRYLEMRDDPAAWSKIISEQGIDGALKYWRAMERQNGTSIGRV